MEHGAKGGDELNHPEAGKNYGWPVITYSREYSGEKIGEGLTEKDGMEQPVHYWTPSIGPSGMVFYTGDRYPQWKGNLFVGALALKHLARLGSTATRWWRSSGSMTAGPASATCGRGRTAISTS